MLTPIHIYDIVALYEEEGDIPLETHENIKYLREHLGLSQESLAEKVGYKDRSSVAKIEAGLVDLSQSKISSFANALHVTPAQLMGIDDMDSLPHPLSKALPAGAIACDKPILVMAKTVEVPEQFHADFSLTCKGDSMINAHIFDGDIVYIHSQPRVENSQIAAVRIGDEATLKKVYYTPGSDHITLWACNPLYPDMVYEGKTLSQIQILGLAVGFYSTIRHEQ